MIVWDDHWSNFAIVDLKYSITKFFTPKLNLWKYVKIEVFQLYFYWTKNLTKPRKNFQKDIQTWELRKRRSQTQDCHEICSCPTSCFFHLWIPPGWRNVSGEHNRHPRVQKDRLSSTVVPRKLKSYFSSKQTKVHSQLQGLVTNEKALYML